MLSDPLLFIIVIQQISNYAKILICINVENTICSMQILTVIEDGLIEIYVIQKFISFK